MYATYREPERTVRVTVVQPNIDPYYEKFVLKQAEQRGILLSLMAQAPEDVDFIVAPETAIDEDFWEKSIGRAPAIARCGTTFSTARWGSTRRSGSAFITRRSS